MTEDCQFAALTGGDRLFAGLIDRSRLDRPIARYILNMRCGLGKGAGSPFTFCAHRLSSPYRPYNLTQISFNFLEFLKKLSAVPGAPFEYFEEDERGVRAA